MATANSNSMSGVHKAQHLPSHTLIRSSMGMDASPPQGLSAPRETAVSMAFSRLLPILAAYTHAERDLEQIDYSMDVAYAAWHHEAEAAQDRLIDVVQLLRDTPARLEIDAPLRRVALLIHAMRQEPEMARDLHRRMDADFHRRFRVHGTGPSAQHRNALLNLCRPMLAGFVSLPIFDQGLDSEEVAVAAA